MPGKVIAGYHSDPGRLQVLEWYAAERLEDGWGYRHFLLRDQGRPAGVPSGLARSILSRGVAPMKFGLDMAFPPTAAPAAEMSSLGYTFCICYVGGDGALAGDTWHIIDGQRYPVRDIAPSFRDGFMPTYVPGQDPFGYAAASGAGDGADANMETGACGFNETSPMFLDIQYSVWTRNPGGVMQYIPEFVRVCNEVGHPVVVYGPTTLVDLLVPRVGTLVDGVWGADIILTARNNAPASFWSWADPAEPPPWSFWQCGSGTIAGVSVDYDTATDDAPLAPYAGP